MILLSTGAVDTSIDVLIVDDTGLPVTGLVAATFPTVKYSKGTGNDATISLTDLSALTDAHSDGGVKERGEGVYRLDLPDAVATTACPKVTLRGEASGKRLIAPHLWVGYPVVSLGNIAHGGAAATIQAERIIVASSTSNEPAIKATGNGTAAGIQGTGGATGPGIAGTGGASSGAGIQATASAGNSSGIAGQGQGSGAGMRVTGGATGQGFNAVGGGTSGNAIEGSATDGHGMSLAATGSNKHGLVATGGTGGTSDGIKGAAGTGGVDIRGAITGNITGNLSGSVGSVTGHTGQTGDVYAALTGAQAEPGQGAPAVNASVLTKIAYLFKSWRNKKTQTSSVWNLYADDATTIDQKATVSDDATTATKGEIATGP